MLYIWGITFLVFLVIELLTVNLVSIWFICGSIVAFLVSLFVESVALQFVSFIITASKKSIVANWFQTSNTISFYYCKYIFIIYINKSYSSLFPTKTCIFQTKSQYIIIYFTNSIRILTTIYIINYLYQAKKILNIHYMNIIILLPR